MKVLILSDVHANIDALRAVWEREQDSDAVLCAGDLTDYGFFPAEVIDWMREHGALCVRGNHDDGVIFHKDYRIPAGSGYTFSQLNSHRLSAEQMCWLEALPTARVFQADGVTYYIRHMFDGYRLIEDKATFDAEWAAASLPSGKRCMIFGHTHEQRLCRLDDTAMWCNPGSVSYQRDDASVRGAFYAVATDGCITLHCVPTRRDRVRRLAEESLLIPHEREIVERIFPPDT